jgi:SecD/SecF fusion protein
MNRFTSKIAICVIPVLLSAVIVGYAFYRYGRGEGGFKLGVDLAGGTDLIYEVDQDKFQEGQKDEFSTQKLAAQLKRRIDPADLYNVTIRPVGPNRVEIILPTGGEHQAEVEDKVWKELLAQVAERWPPKDYKVGLGRDVELLARINEQFPDRSVQEIKDFINKHYSAADAADPAKRESAWKNLLAAAAKEYKPRSYQVGPGRLAALVNRIREQYPENSTQEIEQFLNENYKISRERRHLTSEQVQEVKELISRVGSLEFRILANTTDDKEAVEAAQKWYAEVQKDPERRRELEALAVAGRPPTRPTNPNSDPKDTFPVANDPGVPHSYTWVELGKAERAALGLSNAMANDPGRKAWWDQVATAREKGETVLVPPNIHPGGILLFSRNAVNPRLSDKEAGKKYEYFLLTRDSEKGKEITGSELDSAYETQGNGFQLQVGFRFKPHGGELFGELTTKNKPESSAEGAFRRYLAVVLDGKIESAPRLNAVITTDGVIEGRFTKEEVDRLVRILRAGALSATLKPQPVSESTMGATLGDDTIKAGTFSVLLAFAAILLFMLVYYRFAGIVACVALLANLLLTVAFMVLVNATFTLPGLAGLVLMLGMAVDANVLIYERLREERDRGASLALAIRNGYDRAFPTIIDTHLSSIFTAIVLYAVGNDQLKGFGISLTVGLIISLFTSLYMTRLMFDVWLFKGWLHKLSMFRFLTRPNIDFMAIRYYWFTATIVLTILGASVFFYRLDRGGLNIDFTKGTAYGGKLTKAISIQELRSKLETNSDLPDLSVEQILVNDPAFSENGKSKLFTVRTSEQDAEKVQVSVNKQLGDLLAKTALQSYKIEPDNKRAILSFSDPSTNEPAYASRSLVSLLLSRQFTNQGLKQAADEFVLEGLGAEKQGHFQWMELQLVSPVPRDRLEAVLKTTQAELAARPQPERLENFDSQLAAETQQRALAAILLSWGAILLYLWFRFGNWTFGLAAVICLIHDLFFTLGIIAFCHYIHQGAPGLASALAIQDFKIDLPTVAALLTLVGYSVNDTIVVFDRIREVRGKNPLLTPQMINDSVNQTLSRTLLTAFSVWLVVSVLYIWGGEGVHLFAFVMVVGVIVGTYSSIYIASPLLLIFGEGAQPASRSQQTQERAESALT